MASYPLACRSERVALMQMFIDLNQAIHDSIFHPDQTPEGEMDPNLSLIAAAVLLGHAAGQPLTPTEIADCIRMSRPSVIHGLRKLMEHGIVIRSEGKYYLEPERAANVPMLERFTKILAASFSVLGPYLASKMDAAPK